MAAAAAGGDCTRQLQRFEQSLLPKYRSDPLYRVPTVACRRFLPSCPSSHFRSFYILFAISFTIRRGPLAGWERTGRNTAPNAEMSHARPFSTGMQHGFDFAGLQRQAAPTMSSQCSFRCWLRFYSSLSLTKSISARK